jgi:hypothetical protein
MYFIIITTSEVVFQNHKITSVGDLGSLKFQITNSYIVKKPYCTDTELKLVSGCKLEKYLRAG